MSRRRKLLLVSVPAALALAALVWALARDGRWEAERRVVMVREGMTLEEAEEVLGGPETSHLAFKFFRVDSVWVYPDGSRAYVQFEGYVVQFEGNDLSPRVMWKGVRLPAPWHERLLDRLREWGLPV